MLFESLNSQEMQLNVNWEDVVCPVCLEFPHNAILLHCSSYDKGCRPFMCDTDHYHSNCLDRFKAAHGLPTASEPYSSISDSPGQIFQPNPTTIGGCPICPLCRGEVTGCVVVNEARLHLNVKERCCQEKNCSFAGNYMELQVHTKQNHPNAHPSEIDPARKIEWENFQQSTELIDVLSTIRSEVPHSLVLGDYVVEYLIDSGDEYDDLGDDGNWWTSCIFYHMFENFRACGHRRRRSRTSDTRNHVQRSMYDASSRDEGSTSSVDVAENEVEEMDGDEEVVVGSSSSGNTVSGGSTNHRSYRRRRSQV